MNQSELITKTAALSGLTKAAVGKVLDAATDVVTGSLVFGEDVALFGLGKLTTSHKEARIGRNPRTGESHPIPARTVVKFRVAKALKDVVAN